MNGKKHTREESFRMEIVLFVKLNATIITEKKIPHRLIANGELKNADVIAQPET